ncbi:MSHA biogenesis protein MshQ [hydrothermal vent metagenome]|uniref:MSHA biogenesis protein MshQ n=1 Tax=hydrothermal vent metagenome TaxID=652676 RepID=A0A3B1A0C8_9ZZZZ
MKRPIVQENIITPAPYTPCSKPKLNFLQLKLAQLFIFITLLLIQSSITLAATYTSGAETFSWIDPASHTDVVWTAAPGGPANECSGFSINTDDDISQTIPMGFNFSFGGTSYPRVRITSNGRIQFNNTYCGYGTQTVGPPRTYPFPLPDTRLNNAMRIYGADLDPSAAGSVRYAALGSSPNRFFVITWSNVQEWGAATSNFDLQIILHESGDFVYQYGTITNPTLGSAQVGWHISTNDYQLYEYGNVTSLQNSALRFSPHTPAPLSYYAMDELSWNGSAAEIRDGSGNNNHGDRVGSAQTIDSGYICRGGNIPANNDAINTNMDVDSAIGNRGTITFWFNSNSAWSSGNNMLADASSNLGNGNADKYFFLVKRSSGRLRFRLEAGNDADLQAETSTNSFSSNSWHHVTITWDVVNDADWLQVYIDGARRATSRGNRNGPLNVSNVLGNLQTLFFGDNRNSGVSGSGYTGTPANGAFDEARIYTDVLSAAQITNDMNETHDCLYAAWNMDQAVWNNTLDEVVDTSGNNNHGTAFNGVLADLSNPVVAGSPGTCNYGEFDGVDDYIDLGSLPNLIDSFTMTAWINPVVINQDQRIFADDQNNSGGFAFSLGDGGNGRLRFFSRNVNPIILDSPAVINAGSWQHVAAVHDVNAKTRQLFVNGVAVTSAQPYTGTWGSDTGTASLGGENNSAGSEAVPRWRFQGSIDEVRVYARALSSGDITAVMNETRACASTFDHLLIEHDGSALTCEPESITVRACLNSDCSSVYLGDVAITLSPSGWAGGDNKIVSGGSSTFQLPRTAAGAVTLAISTPSPSPNNGIQCLNTATNSTDCTLTYYDTGFIYSIPTQTSCATSSSITISAVRLDDATQACIPTFVGQTRNVDFSLNYANPSTGTQNLTLNYNGTDYAPINTAISQTVPISFDVAGQANFTVTYPDAGQITLNSVYNGSAGTGDAGLVMNGATSYVTKPYKLYVSSDDANASCAAASATCSAFRRAGDIFNLKVAGTCEDNSVTPNFQLTGLTMAHTNIAPAINQGTLGISSFNIGAADNGEHTISTQTVSEVGAFSFTAALPVSGYFSETIGDATLNTSATLGRFYPSHFCLSAAALLNRTDANTATSCTDAFSYLDEEFNIAFTLSAQAFATSCSPAGITQNYNGNWSKFVTPFSEDTSNANETGKWNFAAVNSPLSSPTNLSSRINLDTVNSTPGDFSNGTANINANLMITRLGSAPGYTAENPFNNVRIGVNPIDTDNVGIDSTDLTIGADTYRQTGNTELFFGRLFAENAFGTNQTDVGLDMYAYTEYCSAVSSGNCTSWQRKIDDSCTLYNVNPPAGVQLGSSPAAIGTPGYYLRASPSVSSATFNFNDSGVAATYARIHVPDTNNNSAGWRLFYTAGGNGGDFTIPFTFPFNSDTTVHPYLLDVDGVASFGQFRGDDRIIFWREVLE